MNKKDLKMYEAPSLRLWSLSKKASSALVLLEAVVKTLTLRILIRTSNYCQTNHFIFT